MTTGELTAEELERIAGWQLDAQLLRAERRAGRGRREIELPPTLAVSDLVEIATDPGVSPRMSRVRCRRLPRRQPAAEAASTPGWSSVRRAARCSILTIFQGPATPRRPSPTPTSKPCRPRFLATSWAALEPVAVEVPFELVLSGILVRGRIDAVYRREDGGYDVIDYKTGARPRGAAAKAAAIQLGCYRQAWADIARVQPEKVGAAFLYIRDGEDGLVRPQLPTAQELATLVAAPGGGSWAANLTS